MSPRPRPADGPLADGHLLLGVDFTSAPCPRKPITAAIGRWRAGRPVPTWVLEDVLELPSLTAFDALLATPGPWVGGFDLPFGQARELVEHEGWPREWAACVRHYCRQPRPALRDAFRRWCDARPPGAKFAWRRTDRPAGSSPAMRWTNPPVAWMMHAGIGRMLTAGLAFPAHRHPARGRGAAAARIALEAYPAFTVRRVCREPYKSDAAAGRTPERVRRRRTILAALRAGRAGLALTATLPPALGRRIVADAAGDLLDAVICGLQAAHAAALPRFGLPPELDPLEGWIATVPPSLIQSASVASVDAPRDRG